LLFSSPLFSQEIEEEEQSPDTLTVGMYVFSVYDIDFPQNQLNIDFYIWYTFKNDSLNPSETFELVNDKQFEKATVFTEDYGEINYQTFRVNSVIREKWDISDFPFDSHTIEIVVEDFEDKNSKIFIPDFVGTKLDTGVMEALKFWDVVDYGIKEVDYVYETNYGDPTVSGTDYPPYSRIVFYFTLKRQGLSLFIKLFVGLFISILLSLVTFMINPMDLDPRFGLSVGALFAAIANSFVIASTLPETASFTFVDILHNLSYIYIFLCILISAISLKLWEAGKQKQSKRLDMISFGVMSGSIVVIGVYFVYLMYK
jgi:hypothetical protein